MPVYLAVSGETKRLIDAKNEATVAKHLAKDWAVTKPTVIEAVRMSQGGVAIEEADPAVATPDDQAAFDAIADKMNAPDDDTTVTDEMAPDDDDEIVPVTTRGRK